MKPILTWTFSFKFIFFSYCFIILNSIIFGVYFVTILRQNSMIDYESIIIMDISMNLFILDLCEKNEMTYYHINIY